MPTHELTEPDRPGVPRLDALDGLRGLAALVVVVHHALLTMSPFAALYVDDAGRPTAGSPMWWLGHTPLHGLWAGTEAVFVFFVLSGFVLALPWTGRGMSAADVASYYPRRLLRLYLPVWAALVLAFAGTALVQPGNATGSSWLQRHADVSLGGTLRDGTLLLPLDSLITALWSLKWEVAFSLALPAVVWFARRARCRLLPGAALLLAVAGGGWAVGSAPLMFGPVFALGVLAAFERDRLAAAAHRIDRSRRSTALWGLLAGTAAVGFSGYWSLLAWFPPHPAVTAAGRALEIAAAGLVVFLALHWTPFRALLRRPAVAWLGTRSFSLYLVHEPVLVAVASALQDPVGGWVTVAVGIPLALLLCELFFRAVEGPSHRLSRAVGRRVAARPRPAPAAPVPAAASRG